LRPGGIIIPHADRGWAAVVEVPDLYSRLTGPWDRRLLDIRMDPARQMVTNTTTSVDVDRQHLLTECQRWGVLDYATVEQAEVGARMTWTVVRSGIGHGLAVGFDRVLCDGVRLSNAPDADAGQRPTVYPRLFFPWPSAVSLDRGDVAVVDLQGRLVKQDYVWTWKTEIFGQGRTDLRKAQFSQSTFYGAPLSPERLSRQCAGFSPTLSEEGRIARLVLDGIADGRSLGEIAQLVSTSFNRRFARAQDALDHVVELSRRYC
jgi:hypothetical protein